MQREERDASRLINRRGFSVSSVQSPFSLHPLPTLSPLLLHLPLLSPSTTATFTLCVQWRPALIVCPSRVDRRSPPRPLLSPSLISHNDGYQEVSHKFSHSPNSTLTGSISTVRFPKISHNQRLRELLSPSAVLYSLRLWSSMTYLRISSLMCKLPKLPVNIPR